MEVELRGGSRRLEGAEGVVGRDGALDRRVDRPRLAFDTDLDVGREGGRGKDQGERPEYESASKHESSFREGFGLRRSGRSSDSGLPPAPPSRPEGQWLSRRGSVSPHSGGTVPDSHRVPFPLAGLGGGEPIMGCRVSLERFLKLWGPVIAWAALIFGLSSIPALDSGLGTWDEVLRKLAHVTEYAVLGFLLVRAIGREAPALLVGIAYAASDEIHQHFVAGRHGSPVDVLIDAVGLLIGTVVVRRVLLQSRRA